MNQRAKTKARFSYLERISEVSRTKRAICRYLSLQNPQLDISNALPYTVLAELKQRSGKP